MQVVGLKLDKQPFQVGAKPVLNQFFFPAQYFREDEGLAEKAETLIQTAMDCSHMDSAETELILETHR